MTDASFYHHIKGFRVQTDTVQVTLTVQEARAVMRDALRYLQGNQTFTEEGEVSNLTIPSESIKWLNTNEED